MNTNIINNGLLVLVLCTPLGVWADGKINQDRLSASAVNAQAEYLLLDTETLDKVVGYTEVDAEGHPHLYLRRNLEGVVDRIVEHTDDALHNHGENYQYWREYLRKPHPSVETVQHFFTKAAQEFGVPVEILQAIGQVENNWTQMGPSIDQGWGIMHLVQNDYADTLTEAANLLGVSQPVLKDDAFQNIRGAAALLAKYAGPQRSNFTKLEDWFEAVKQFSGLINDELRDMQARRYYNVIKTGVVSNTLWGETIRLDPHPDIHISPQTASRNTRSADYAPAVANLTPCNYKAGRNHVLDTWINHWIGTGTYAGAISTFHNCTRQASAHFIVSATGEITQIVAVDNTAWHAGASGYPYNNSRSIGVEHEVTVANSEGWNTTWTTPLLKASADMARYFADLYAIPKTRPAAKADVPGIRAHNDMPGTNTACPGTFPWNTWMSYFSGTGGGKFGHFDGAGSLIDSSQACWGCNQDETIMHPHSGALSTVVFQWKNDSRCDHIDISSNANIGEVIIQSRAWDNHFNTTAYQGHLPLSVLGESVWNIVAVTSTTPLTTSAEIFAYCKQSYDPLTDNYDNRTVLIPELVDFDFSYYWTGNGSLISKAGTGTGKTQDWAVTYNGHKSLTVFQWYASDSCTRVSLRDNGGNTVTLNGQENEVALKLWHERDWTQTACSSLPCSVSATQGEGYYLIKIKTESNAVPSGVLKASCF